MGKNSEYYNRSRKAESGNKNKNKNKLCWLLLQTKWQRIIKIMKLFLIF